MQSSLQLRCPALAHFTSYADAERTVASQRKRKLIEEAFGWAKTIAGIAKVKVRGLKRVRHCFTLAMTAYNLIRMPKLLASAAA